ncbi:MAG: VOC family protein [Rhodospirillales bacterium]|nr:VOC family protein [Rhodospirillales bacterium]
MKPKISLITLGVRNLAASLAFYRDGLGFPVHSQTQDHLMFAMEGSWLALYPRAMLAADATVPDDGGGFPGFTLAHNVATPEEADTVFARALAAGARAVKRPTPASWGGYSGYFADPDGYLWEVAVNPFTDLT